MLARPLLLLLLIPLAARADESVKPPRSRWGAQRFSGASLPALTFEKFGHLTPKGVRNIQSFVSSLRPRQDQVILLRGQKRLHERVSRLPADRSAWPAKIAWELKTAENLRQRRLADMAHHDAIARGVGCSDRHEQHKRYIQEAGPLDMLVEHHQSTYGSPLFVAASRSLKVAAGDYNMRRTDNSNRFIYVLLAPKNRCVNVHGLDKLKGEMFMSQQALKNHGNQRIKEREVAVWLDATDCVAGLYDTVKDKFMVGGRP
jgi:hypothetical protein